MKLYIARHGETDWNREPARCQGWADIPVNKKGEQQAARIAFEAGTKNISKIFSSHLQRAAQTAAIIASELGVPYETDKGLAEARKGSWEGMPFSQIEAEYSEIWAQWLETPFTAPIPGGETISEVAARACRSIKNFLEQDAGNILLISHGGPVSALRCISEKLSFGRFHSMHPGNGQLFKLAIEPFIMLNEDTILGFEKLTQLNQVME